MKSFFSFLSEAAKSQASQQAEKLKLTSDGHGNWFDRDGELVARTVKGRLEFLDKKSKVSQEEPQPKKKEVEVEPEAETKAQTTAADSAEVDGEESEFGAFPDGTPRRMPAPTRADGTPKEDRGDVTVVFGRFNPPTIGHQKLLDAAKKAAGKGSLRIYPSRSVDPKKNPLDPDQKYEIMQQMFLELFLFYHHNEHITMRYLLFQECVQDTSSENLLQQEFPHAIQMTFLDIQHP